MSGTTPSSPTHVDQISGSVLTLPTNVPLDRMSSARRVSSPLFARVSSRRVLPRISSRWAPSFRQGGRVGLTPASSPPRVSSALTPRSAPDSSAGPRTVTAETLTWYPGGPFSSCMSCTQYFSTLPSSPSEARSSVHWGNEKTGVPSMAPVPMPPPPYGAAGASHGERGNGGAPGEAGRGDEEGYEGIHHDELRSFKE
ncbi:hypothetical protein VUR80DRAFT_10244 [Thermomyces stellatus]